MKTMKFLAGLFLFLLFSMIYILLLLWDVYWDGEGTPVIVGMWIGIITYPIITWFQKTKI